MRLNVGITDRDWYRHLSVLRPDEVNFWKPGAKGTFGVLQPGELFLFKLHAPDQFIVGGGHFVRYSPLPMSLAWLAFGEKNGVRSEAEFLERIRKYRRGEAGPDPVIGNIVLAQPFWFERKEWISAPLEWPRSAVQGKSYPLDSVEGARLLREVRARLEGLPGHGEAVREHAIAFGTSLAKVRLGQGAFRVVVTDAYQRRCAITGESTLPVLEASHIRPVSADGPHDVRNGLLLRSDMHTLFDKGLLTVTPEHRIEVSSEIKEQYVNGRRYYAYHGEALRSVPAAGELPLSQFLAYHNERVFRP